jgi:hypothetical protein
MSSLYDVYTFHTIYTELEKTMGYDHIQQGQQCEICLESGLYHVNCKWDIILHAQQNHTKVQRVLVDIDQVINEDGENKWTENLS